MGKMLSFHIKFVQTDRRTTVKQYAPDLLIRGHKNSVLVKTESLCRQQFQCGSNGAFFHYKVVNIVGIFFPTISSTGLFPRGLESLYCVVNGFKLALCDKWFQIGIV